jgi:hypothetical protein
MHLSPAPTCRVYAVVVTYNPMPSLVENVAVLSTQVDHIVVVDNGSSSETGIHLMGLGHSADAGLFTTTKPGGLWPHAGGTMSEVDRFLNITRFGQAGGPSYTESYGGRFG